ncbi:aldo/keto reductase [Facilibium subflavum]|uniref:aldo/keto reductase n=1 Tax=Facilibium subflavum TaxID=2219058 RepID=UPI000E645DE5|nr:aldo/keto reductase [Facilibium subflavum]
MSKYVNLGQLRTSSIGFGAMGCSEFYGSIDNNEARKTIHRYIQLVGKHAMIDTADSYGFGKNEQLVGSVINEYKRDDIILATKCGIIRDKNDLTKRGVDTSASYIKEACYKSLDRLKADYIDLYYLHRLDGVTPIEESMVALQELAKEGVIKYIGLSEANAVTIEKAYKFLQKSNEQNLLAAIQTEYSLWSRGVENDGVLTLCREFDIGLVAYSPLGRGFLTGTIHLNDELEADDFRRDLPRFLPDNLEKNKVIIGKMTDLSHKLGCTLSQLALAWLLKQANVVPIPGTKREKYLLENMQAIDIKLSDSDLLALNNLPKAFGYRYPEAAMERFAYTK